MHSNYHRAVRSCEFSTYSFPLLNTLRLFHLQERDDHSDVEEIVETVEPINVDDFTVVEESVIAVDDTSVLEKSDDTAPVQESEVGIEADAAKEVVTIKQEKPDSHTSTTPRVVESTVPKESNEGR